MKKTRLRLGAVRAVLAALMTIGFGLMVWLGNDHGGNIMYFAMIILPVSGFILGIANWQAAVLCR